MKPIMWSQDKNIETIAVGMMDDWAKRRADCLTMAIPDATDRAQMSSSVMNELKVAASGCVIGALMEKKVSNIDYKPGGNNSWAIVVNIFAVKYVTNEGTEAIAICTSGRTGTFELAAGCKNDPTYWMEAL